MSGSGGVVGTFPIAPPSTIRGFLGALGAFQGLPYEADPKFRYGFVRPPLGRGQILRKAAVWASKPKEQLGNTIRPLFFDTLFDLHYWIEVETDSEIDLDNSSADYLGESYDRVTAIYKLDSIPKGATMIVPGRTLALPWRSGHGYGTHNAEYRAWDLVPASE